MLLLTPNFARALSIDDLKPQVDESGLTAQSSIVLDQVSGQVLYKNAEGNVHIPASLVKLLTVLVVLDTKPSMTKSCSIEQVDEVGGVRINAAPGTKFKLRDLLYATLIPSANNAAHALARCTGLDILSFVARMNVKAQSFGAMASIFLEPTGISELNTTTAADLAKIANAAFSTKFVREITRVQQYRLCSIAPSVKCQSIKNTNQLLTDKEVTTIAGKTGYLDEARFNFAGSFRDSRGKYFIIVILGSSNKESRFAEAKQLLQFASNAAAWQDQFGGIK